MFTKNVENREKVNGIQREKTKRVLGKWNRFGTDLVRLKNYLIGKNSAEWKPQGYATGPFLALPSEPAMVATQAQKRGVKVAWLRASEQYLAYGN